ncbi:hypothetical protein G7A72_16330 [Flavobacterium sp. Sr18]|uniref:hypothetical protein n=1 Tax=Flavobacterium sp. Sr18 TaxID=935222 RepID=UPI0013E51586|nr:hypothetical protein [Flavobacterium sp. Sr18]QIH40277.1 hypothetical protein G7A72_16330 [Flavobacterium sp. Sr18]
MIQFDIYRDSTKEIYADDIPEFSSSQFWGNLSNKVLFIFNRLDYLNDTLISICENVEIYNINFKKRNGLTSSKVKISPYIEIIHVMSDLRMIVDELIVLLYIVEKREVLGDYPNILEIESTGDLLRKWNENKFDDVKFFIDYKDFLKNLSDINNAYKHSFINDHIIFYRQLEKPTVYAIRNPKKEFNILKNKLIAIPLEDIVIDFNKMFKEYRILLKKITIEQIINDFEKKNLI